MNKIANTKIIISTVVFIGIFGLAKSSQAATYYVATNGSDSSSGSSSAPFKTIQKAADIVNPGDTVIVRDGVYAGGTRIINLNRSGTSSNWITFKSENKWGAVIDGQNSGGYGFFLTDNVAYVNVEDFEIKNLINIAIFADNNVHHIRIYRNKIHNTGKVCLDPCVDYSAADTGHPALYARNTTHHITVDSNVIYTTGRLHGCACQTYYWFDYNHDHAMYYNGNYHTIQNNVLWDIKSGWPILVSAEAGEHIGGWIISNNTFYDANPERDGHILVQGVAEDILIQNNISYESRNYMVTGDASNDSNVTVRNNIVYGASLATTANCSHWSCSNNIIGQDPKLVNLANKDFHLQSTSPAINKGLAYSGRTVDADGKSIVGLPDIGAYEYNGGGTDTTAPAAPQGLTVK